MNGVFLKLENGLFTNHEWSIMLAFETKNCSLG
jgi:hypothetical protein